MFQLVLRKDLVYYVLVLDMAAILLTGLEAILNQLLSKVELPEIYLIITITTRYENQSETY